MGKINRFGVKTDSKILKERGYEIVSVLGEGSFSVVKSAKWTKAGNQQNVALKIINRTTAPESFIDKFWPREEKVLTSVQHENIIRLHEIFSEGSKIFVCLELAPRGDLLEYLQLKGCLTEHEAHELFLQMVSAIEYLHNKNIVHRDLKCENILLTGKAKIKLTDFGFAAPFKASTVSDTYCGSAAYASPEVLQGIPYKPPIPDIWSLGVILYILCCNAMPFRDSSIKKLVEDQQSSEMNFPNQDLLSENYRNLVSKILCYKAEKRFGLKEIKRHKWYSEPSVLHCASEGCKPNSSVTSSQTRVVEAV